MKNHQKKRRNRQVQPKKQHSDDKPQDEEQKMNLRESMASICTIQAKVTQKIQQPSSERSGGKCDNTASFNGSYKNDHIHQAICKSDIADDRQSMASNESLKTNQIFQSRFFYGSQVDVSEQNPKPQAIKKSESSVSKFKFENTSQKSDYFNALAHKKKKRPAFMGIKKTFSQNNSISAGYSINHASFEEEEVIEENIEIEESSIQEPFLNKDYQQNMKYQQIQHQHPFICSAKNSSSSHEEKFHMPFFPKNIGKNNFGLFQSSFLIGEKTEDIYDLEQQNFIPKKEETYDLDFLNTLNNQVYQPKKLKKLDDIPIDQFSESNHTDIEKQNLYLLSQQMENRIMSQYGPEEGMVKIPSNEIPIIDFYPSEEENKAGPKSQNLSSFDASMDIDERPSSQKLHQFKPPQFGFFNSQANEKDEEDIVNIKDEEETNISRNRKKEKHNFVQVPENIPEKTLSEEIKEEIKAQSNESMDLYSRHSSVLNIQSAKAQSVSSRRTSIKSKSSHHHGVKFSYFAASSLSDDRWLCPICLDIFEDAVETPCCHNLFCEACIKQTTTCPLCNLRIVGQLRPNIPIRRLVHELSINCPNEECNHISKIGDIDKHLAQCKYTPISCPNSEICGKILRKNIDEHKLSECPFRIVNCILECGLMLPLNDMDEHIREDCIKFEIQCKNNCGANIQRGKMQYHISQTCPLEIVECPNKGESLFEEGCTIKLKRREMESHKITCNFRRVQCQNLGCSAVIIYKDLQSHDDRCLCKVIECDNKCGCKIQRQNLERHREICEFQLVKCPYYNLGCKIEILRKDYKNHLQEEYFNHSIIFIEGQKRKNGEIDELKNEIVNLRKDYDVEIKTMFLELNRVKHQLSQIKAHTKMEENPDESITQRQNFFEEADRKKQVSEQSNFIKNQSRLKPMQPMIGLGNNRLNHYQNKIFPRNNASASVNICSFVQPCQDFGYNGLLENSISNYTNIGSQAQSSSGVMIKPEPDHRPVTAMRSLRQSLPSDEPSTSLWPFNNSQNTRNNFVRPEPMKKPNSPLVLPKLEESKSPVIETERFRITVTKENENLKMIEQSFKHSNWWENKQKKNLDEIREGDFNNSDKEESYSATSFVDWGENEQVEESKQARNRELFNYSSKKSASRDSREKLKVSSCASDYSSSNLISNNSKLSLRGKKAPNHQFMPSRSSSRKPKRSQQSSINRIAKQNNLNKGGKQYEYDADSENVLYDEDWIEQQNEEEKQYKDFFADWEDEARAGGPDECGEEELGDDKVQRHNFRNKNKRFITVEEKSSEDGFEGVVWKIN